MDNQRPDPANALDRENGQTKELKVRIPVDQHLWLHSLKLLTGKPISEAVTEAVDTYLAEVRQQDKELFASVGGVSGLSMPAIDEA